MFLYFVFIFVYIYINFITYLHQQSVMYLYRNLYNQITVEDLNLLLNRKCCFQVIKKPKFLFIDI